VQINDNVPSCITQVFHPHTQISSTILEYEFDVEISSSTCRHENYVVQFNLFLEKPDDGH